ncbi:hypothetical protein HPB50_006823 [Hyalomma asiaticum]|uniref:Uncharacterized protein n=1 Tax=Hyalomma asiaticum TaxID=266040 RepID=A0ACB7SNP3_HYAAI|nr:hypothetical protein HPB50_006823 [Hyalomma asiaticum]
MSPQRKNVAGQASNAHGRGNADAHQEAAARANGPASTLATGSAPRPPAATFVIRPAGTFNNAREVLDWLGVHHQTPEAQRYDCFAANLPAGIPAPPPATGRGGQPHQDAVHARRQSYAVTGHPPHSVITTTEGGRHSHKRPHVATVTGKPGTQENAAAGPAVGSDATGTAHGAPPGATVQNATAFVAHGVPVSLGTSNAPHGTPQTVQNPPLAMQLRPSSSVESLHPDSVPASAPGGLFSWIPKIFTAPDDQAPGQFKEAAQQFKTPAATGLPVHAGVAVQPVTQSPSTIIYGSEPDTLSETTPITVGGRSWEARSLCCVIFGMLLMPTCLFVLSYYLTPRDVAGLPPLTKPTSSTGPTPFTTMPTLPNIFLTYSTPPTADAWARVPSYCFSSSAINGNISGLKLSAYEPFGRKPPQRIFCLYNNSRFLRGHKYDFVPENLPLDYCNYIVYWSVAIANASVSSRAQQFDAMYGLWRLRQVLQKHQLAQTVGVLMALGGYPEDSVYFSRLGRDPSAMGRFVASVVQTINTHRLDGVTIHWVTLDISCQGPDDISTMSDLVGKFREAYWINGWITPPNLADGASRYTAVPGTASLFEVCSAKTVCLDTSEQFCNVLRIPSVISSSASSTSPPVTSSATSDMPSDTIAIDVNDTIYTNATVDVDLMDVNTTVDMNSSVTASAPTSAPTSAKSFEPGAVVFHNEATLSQIFFHGLSGFGRFCALLYDLDMDNYDSTCPATGTQRVSLSQLHDAIATPPTDSLRGAFPPC